MCKDCVFYVFKTAAKEGWFSSKVEVGECHLNALSPRVASWVADSSADERLETRWPNVKADDWCGQFARREDADETLA